jgi:hypothetical protein
LDSFRSKLALLGGEGRKAEPSAARAEIRKAYAEIKAAREERQVSWRQIADLLASEGIPCSADKVRALYHAEARLQGEPKKRRRAKPKAARQNSGAPELAAPPAAVAASVTVSGNPYAEHDRRRQEEAERRRQAEERRKRRADWNPFVPGSDGGTE